MNKRDIDTTITKDLYRLSVLIKQTDNAIQKSRDNELRKFGITPEQAAALICIRSLGNRATSAEIARWLFRDDCSVLVLIRRMAKQGLISKNVDPDNKHWFRIKLTDKGSTAYDNAIEFLSFHDIFSCLSQEKQQQLCSLLDTLRARAFEVLRLDVDTYSGLFSKELVLGSARTAPIRVKRPKLQKSHRENKNSLELISDK